MNQSLAVLPLTTAKRKKRLNKQLFMCACIFAAMLSMNIVYAENIFEAAGDMILEGIDILSPIDDIFSSILLFFFKIVVSVVAGMLDALIDPVQTLTSYSMDQLNDIIPLYSNGGDSYGEIASRYINNLAQFIWIVLALMGILANMIYTAQGNKKAETPGRMFVGIVTSGVLMFIAQDLMYLLFDSVVQPLTAEFSDALDNSSLLSSSTGLFNFIGTTFIQGFSNGLISILLAIIMLIIIGVNFFKLALEMVQRYVIIAVLCILSPLAFAAGACQETRDISKRWFRMFWSQAVLLFLNVWCIGISLQCMINVQSYGGDIVIWALITYGFIKVALQLDDILKNAGLDITKQTSGLMEDIWTAGRAMSGVIGGAAAVAGAGKSLASDLPKVRSGEMSAAQAIHNMARSFNPQQHPLMSAAMAPFGAAAAAYAMRSEDLAKKDMLKDFAKTGAERKQNRQNYNSDLAKKTAKDVLSKSSDERLRQAAANGDIKLNNSLDKDGSITGTAVTKNEDGSVTRTGFRISGNGRDIQSDLTSVSKTGTDENGNTTIKDSKLGTFAVSQDPNDPNKYNLKQVEDANGNAVDSDNALNMSVRDNNAESVEEAANNIISNNGLEQMQNRMDEAQNFANMSASERMEAGMDMNSVNQEALNNVVADKLSNGENDYLADNGKITSMQMDDNGNLTATVTSTKDGLTTMQDYAIGSGGAAPVGGATKISSTADGRQAAFLNEDTGTAFAMSKTTDSHGHAQWQVSQCDANGVIMENGMQFTAPVKSGESAQDAAMRIANSDAAASSRERYDSAMATMTSGDSAAMNGLDYSSHEARAAYSTLYGSGKDGAAEGSTMTRLTRTDNGTVATYQNSDSAGAGRREVTRADGQSEPVSSVNTRANIVPTGDSAAPSAVVVSNDADQATYKVTPVGVDGDRTVYGVSQLTDASGNNIVDAPESTFTLPTIQNGRETNMNDVASFMVSDKGMQMTDNIGAKYAEAQTEYQAVDSSQSGAPVNNSGYGSAVATDIAAGNFTLSSDSSPNGVTSETMQQAFADNNGKVFVGENRNEYGGLSLDAIYTDPSTGREIASHMEQMPDGTFKADAPLYTHSDESAIGDYYREIGSMASTGATGLSGKQYDGMLSERNSVAARDAFASTANIPEGENVSRINMPVSDNDFISCTTRQELPLNNQEAATFANHEVVRTRVMSGAEGGEVTGRTDIYTAKNGKECTVFLRSDDTTASDVNRMILSDFDGKSITIRHDGKAETIKLNGKYDNIGKIAAEFNGVKDADDFSKVVSRLANKGGKPKGKKKK